MPNPRRRRRRTRAESVAGPQAPPIPLEPEELEQLEGFEAGVRRKENAFVAVERGAERLTVFAASTALVLSPILLPLALLFKVMSQEAVGLLVFLAALGLGGWYLLQHPTWLIGLSVYLGLACIFGAYRAITHRPGADYLSAEEQPT